jgi:hypothetical protein
MIKRLRNLIHLDIRALPKGFLPFEVGLYFNSITPIHDIRFINSELPHEYKIDPFHFA